jgi:hypothetical protein
MTNDEWPMPREGQQFTIRHPSFIQIAGMLALVLA